jgi:collagenase-like PrtC family protease
MAGGIIRPEDIQIFNDMGVHRIKISGRSKPAEWLPEVANAYQQNYYEGNLIRLLGADPSLNTESWIIINNRSLDGFLENFPKNDISKARYYCEKKIIELSKNGNFKLTDGTTYKEQNGHLVIDLYGTKSASIINQEKKYE